MGRKMEYLAMKTDHPAPTQSMNSDMNELKIAAKRLINDATKVGGLGFGTSFLEWVSSFAAILPSVLFNFLRGEFGKWVTFIAVVLRLFFPRYFPDWLEMPGSVDSSSGSCSKLLCTHPTGELGRRLNMSLLLVVICCKNTSGHPVDSEIPSHKPMVYLTHSALSFC
ncbi:hypothetical protein HYC85_005410 [Camellia sinensis]|uniref:Uncharacterized protein n=1 Tax=Camellia sinensis TaxID=4442 RepID=A0A7J7I0D4_CAMSI|nr:hypothetical protein HYC85_005410 [Camellia sinensis]